ITTADAPLTAELPGRTTACRRAEVRPEGTGIIQKRLFEEGAEIKAGTQLYQIDEATYRAAHATAKAELARAEANLLAAAAHEKCYTALVSAKAISQQDYDGALDNLRQARPSLAARTAAVEAATTNLN